VADLRVLTVSWLALAVEDTFSAILTTAFVFRFESVADPIATDAVSWTLNSVLARITDLIAIAGAVRAVRRTSCWNLAVLLFATVVSAAAIDRTLRRALAKLRLTQSVTAFCVVVEAIVATGFGRLGANAESISALFAEAIASSISIPITSFVLRGTEVSEWHARSALVADAFLKTEVRLPVSVQVSVRTLLTGFEKIIHALTALTLRIFGARRCAVQTL
jgi:hypothetical protein